MSNSLNLENKKKTSAKASRIKGLEEIFTD